MAKKRGIFITLEGPDGAGKTTQARLIAAALKRLGRSVTLTREPGGSPLSARVRSLLLDPRMEGMDPGAELLLFAADRSQHVADTIAPALKRGDVVLCDRFTDSTVAYQGAGRALAMPDVAWINHFASHALKPDLTLLFDLAPELGLKRARRRGGKLDRMERGAMDFSVRVRRGFHAIARRNPERVKLVAVAGRTPEAVCAEAMEHLLPVLEGR